MRVITIIIVVFSLFIGLFTSCGSSPAPSTPAAAEQPPTSQPATPAEAPSSTPEGSASQPTSNTNSTEGVIVTNQEIPEPVVGSILKAHFIDVGQADSILIQLPNDQNMLIDAGNNEDSNLVVNYIKDQKISKLDYIVGTHPHEDHIGGMDAVINSFDIGKIYLPKASSNTKTFQDVLTAVKNKGLKVTTAKAGVAIAAGNTLKVEILAPNNEAYEDLNNYSAVVKLTYGTTSFLLTGDAEDISENEMLVKKYDLKSDVLKVGHHGSTSSTTPEFLKAVSPKYAVISVGKDNTYGHPEQQTLDRIASSGIQVFRTDESGTIIATSDGQNITFDKNASPVKPNAPPAEAKDVQSTSNAENKAVVKPTILPVEVKEEQSTTSTQNQAVVNPSPPVQEQKQETTVYITDTGKKYHVDGCRYLKKSKNPISLSDAKAQGYGACGVCHPPQ